MPPFTIAPERPADRDAIRVVHDAAFRQPDEGRLVDALRLSAAFISELSLVAIAEPPGAIVGHVLFTHLDIADGSVKHRALALAPMAVLPAWQRRGIGSGLVRHGLAEARRLGHHVVVVIGHPDYYPRFGFVPARAHGIACPFDAPDDAFLVVGLDEHALDGVRGLVVYPPEFLPVSPGDNRGEAGRAGH